MHIAYHMHVHVELHKLVPENLRNRVPIITAHEIIMYTCDLLGRQTPLGNSLSDLEALV